MSNPWIYVYYDEEEHPIAEAQTITELSKKIHITPGTISVGLKNGSKKYGRMLNEYWVDVNEDLPMLDRGQTKSSVNVLMLLSNGKIKEGFYAYGLEKWLTIKGNIQKNVIGWKSYPVTNATDK